MNWDGSNSQIRSLLYRKIVGNEPFITKEEGDGHFTGRMAQLGARQTENLEATSLIRFLPIRDFLFRAFDLFLFAESI